MGVFFHKVFGRLFASCLGRVVAVRETENDTECAFWLVLTHTRRRIEAQDCVSEACKLIRYYITVTSSVGAGSRERV